MKGMKHYKFWLLSLLLVILASCSSTTSSPPKTTLSQATVFVPPRSEMAPLPTNCPLTAVPGTKLFPRGWGGYLQDTTLIGRSPVWGGIPPSLQIPVSPGNADDPWPGTKILWEVGPNVTPAVNVQVKNLMTGALAWWGHGGQPPSEAVLVLDTDTEGDHGSPVSGWHEWGTELYLLTAGCYSMDVSWSGGTWHVVFAAGRSQT